MAGTQIWTYQDVVDELADDFDMDVSGRLQRIIRRAIDNAYRELPSIANWSYFTRQTTILTAASQTTGSISYDHTGGTYERELTLTGATWPTDAHLYRVKIADVNYDIDAYKSSTVVTLSSANNPGSDVASGTSYDLFRQSYPLPADFRRARSLFDVENEHEIRIVTPELQHRLDTVWYDSPDTPWIAAIRGTQEYYGAMSLIFGPPPDSARTFDLLYEAQPRELKIADYSTGTCSLTAGQTSVSFGGGASLPEEVKGSVIRFGTAATAPTSKIGNLSDVDSLYAVQRVILSRTSATAVEVDETVSSTLTDVKYTISDPIDIEPVAMFNALKALAAANLAMMNHRTDWVERRNMADMLIRRALEADQRTPPGANFAAPYDRFSRVSVSTDDN